MKSARLEWALEQLPAALRLLEDGVRAFPDFAKLWMMRGQILESLGRDAEAKEVYGPGVSEVKWTIAMSLSVPYFERFLAPAVSSEPFSASSLVRLLLKIFRTEMKFLFGKNMTFCGG